MKSISVYLGSSPGKGTKYCEAARELGRQMALRGWRLVYGGAAVGTMEALAEGCLQNGGECVGVFPVGFKGKPEVAAAGIDVEKRNVGQTVYCANFSERKQIMEDMGDCCVALPGSWGTLDELFTYATNTQLGFNGGKKIFLLNLDGYYNTLKDMIQKMWEEGFIAEYGLHMLTFCDTLDDLLSHLEKI